MDDTRRVIMPRLHLRLMALAVAGVLGACTAESAPSATAAPGDACEAFAAVEDSFVAFQALDPGSASIDDYRAGAEEVHDALETYLTLRGSEAAEAEYQLRVTLSQLAVSLRAASGDATIQEAIDESQPEIEAASTAIDSIRADSGCPEES
jgi:hypothetical protein